MSNMCYLLLEFETKIRTIFLKIKFYIFLTYSIKLLSNNYNFILYLSQFF